LLKHDVTGTNFNTGQTSGAGILIHHENAIIQLYCILRTAVRALAALVTEMDPVIARSRKTSFNPQQ
jgi:hypothetical protein